MDNQIRVVLLKPKQPAEVRIISNTLEEFQTLVGGRIELIAERVASRKFQTLCIVNEEGKLLGLEPNIRTGSDVLVGNIVICAEDGVECASLSEQQAQLLCKAYDYKRGLLANKKAASAATPATFQSE